MGQYHHELSMKEKGINEYSDLDVPAIWRENGDAAAKVKALEESGVDPLDIPAFLRKQAD